MFKAIFNLMMNDKLRMFILGIGVGMYFTSTVALYLYNL